MNTRYDLFLFSLLLLLFFCVFLLIFLFLQEADMQLMQLVAAAEDAGVDVSAYGVGGLGVGRPAGRTAHQDNVEYEEFRQPDVNGDNVISKQEVSKTRLQFHRYVCIAKGTVPLAAAAAGGGGEREGVNRTQQHIRDIKKKVWKILLRYVYGSFVFFSRRPGHVGVASSSGRVAFVDRLHFYIPNHEERLVSRLLTSSWLCFFLRVYFRAKHLKVNVQDL